MNLKHAVRGIPRLRFIMVGISMVLLAGCASLDGAGRPVNAGLPSCDGFDDDAISEVFDEIDAAWAQGLDRAEVLAVGFASGCLEQCFTCWEDITDFVFFELH